MSSISVKKLNDIKVSRLQIPHVNIKETKGWKLFPEIYSNIYIVARKRSGKTNLVYNVIKKTTDKDTEIHIFCSTCLKDKAWIEIIKYLEKRGNIVHKHTSIVEDGVNLVEQFMMDNMESKSDVEEESESEEEVKFISIDDCEKEEKPTPVRKKRKKKYISPEHCLIFDDLSTELKDRHLNALYKQNRHYKAKCISSSQNLNDLLPMSRKQQDYWIIMKGMNINKLETIHKDADVSMDFKSFKKVYDYATKKPYSFLYIDTRTDTYRKNFDELIQCDD